MPAHRRGRIADLIEANGGELPVRLRKSLDGDVILGHAVYRLGPDREPYLVPLDGPDAGKIIDIPSHWRADMGADDNTFDLVEVFVKGEWIPLRDAAGIPPRKKRSN